jgi:hypothetical protein
MMQAYSKQHSERREKLGTNPVVYLLPHHIRDANHAGQGLREETEECRTCHAYACAADDLQIPLPSFVA